MSWLDHEWKRDGVRVDGVRVDGPFIGTGGWYVVVREEGFIDRRVRYSTYLKEIRTLSARQHRANRARTFAPRPPCGGANSLARWLKARDAHNQCRSNS